LYHLDLIHGHLDHHLIGLNISTISFNKKYIVIMKLINQEGAKIILKS